MFTLDFDIPKSTCKIGIGDPIYLIGSCFADEMASYLQDFKFPVLANPFGTLYNPLSIGKILRGELDRQNLLQHDGVFYHWDCHGQISGLSEEQLLERFEKQLPQSADFLETSKWIVVTLGTAFVYRLKETGEIVANCHRVPQKEFSKELLSVEDVTKDFERTIERFSDKNILLTVSPVRHFRDGLIENNRSKAVLLQAVHQLVESHSHLHYFPSYEILIDELRDYRFFASDQVHPSEEAVAYIWKRFSETYFDEETLEFLEKWSKIQSAIQHKPFHPASSAHQKFLKETIRKLEGFKELVDISEERKLLEDQLV